MPTATDRNTNIAPDAHRLDARQKQSLRRRLLAWYATHARDLPWRRSADPYRVWISEVMLQQTQVATVRDYFSRFIRALPDVHRLAAADEQQVLRLWEGLGYYRRARQLHAAAKIIVRDFAGDFPHDVDSLRALPGIGRYTAGAIASIAFGRRAPILEANTIRLLSRLVAYRGDPSSSAGQRLLWQLAEDILPQKNVSQFNQALMELGSLVCTPSEPACHECPLCGVCRANAEGSQRLIPRPKARPQFTNLREAAIVVQRNGRVLMRRCAPAERWAGLWDFPRFALASHDPAAAAREITSKLREQTGIVCGPPTLFKTMRHGVTRYRIDLECYRAPYASGRVHASNDSAVRWTTRRELPALPLSSTGRRIISFMNIEATPASIVATHR